MIQSPRLLTVVLFAAATAALPPRVAHAETPLGVTSLAEAAALYRHDVQACLNCLQGIIRPLSCDTPYLR